MWLILSTLAGCTPGIYQDDIALCADLDAAATRLACYDKLAKDLGVDQLADSDSEQDDWRMRTEISPLDDSTNVYLSKPATQAFVTSSGRAVSPVLHIRCKENTTALIAAYGTYLGQGNTQVSYRIDSQPTAREAWQLSTANNSVGLWNGRVAIPFVKRLFDAEQLLLQLTPVGANSVTSAFQVADVDQAIQPLRTACHW